MRRADGVTTISEDVAHVLAQERLPVDRDRVFPVLYGTEHLSGHEPAEFPEELANRGDLGRQFVLCLGTDYAHKNRDLAVAVHQELRRRGLALTFVLAGPSVPFGGSRNAERQLLQDDDDVLFLPNVSSRERNWLMRHATVVLYPTSAEGFGLVPFEAARFGTRIGDRSVRAAGRDLRRRSGRRILVGQSRARGRRRAIGERSGAVPRSGAEHSRSGRSV